MLTMKPFVVIVTGPPCSGKSTLAAVLAAHLRVPLIEKDVIKEALFDTLGASADGDPRAWSRSLSNASFAAMFRLASRIVGQDGSLILEGNFRPEHAREFEALYAAGNATLVQICCGGEGRVLLERSEERARLALRHPGHLDRQAIHELRESLLAGSSPPLQIPGSCFNFDSTSSAPGALEQLVCAVAEAIHPGNAASAGSG
jgi:predicted kinase